MNLVIDSGNTSAKVGIFDNHELRDKFVFSTPELKKFVQNFSADHCIISSVNTDANQIISWLPAMQRKLILTPTLPLPVKNRYATPSTLGVDRLAAACGAWRLFAGSNCLVIDLGTCITYDFLDKNENYIGGGISPGLNMRLKAMHTFTARLPLVQPIETPTLIGDSTESCLQSGAIFGAIEEIDGIIRRYSEKFEGLKVILCGGDTQFFENKLKASIFAVPELVLSGLNTILNYNVDL